jgi:hypothetical protein
MPRRTLLARAADLGPEPGTGAETTTSSRWSGVLDFAVPYSLRCSRLSGF